MTQEEKAKAYDEALERARQFSEHPLLEDSGNIVEYIFPELAKSEDEMIRKRIYNYINATLDDNESEEKEKWLTWLEKQGEKLPVGFYYVNSEGKKIYSDTFKYGDVTLHVEKQGEIDNCPLECSTNTVMTDSKKNQVKPKFKVGDWITIKE